MEVQTQIREGWLCPRCGTINAPWMSCCTCEPEEKDKKIIKKRIVDDDFYDKLP